MALPKKNLTSLMVFLVLVMGGGIAIGTLTAPGEWYANLAKPAFNPPNWIFGPVWTILYLFIALVGWRVWNSGRDKLALRLWFFQMGLNFLWSPVFFSAKRTDLALLIISLLFLMILAFIARTWSSDRLSSVLFIPYAVWVAFASVLNGAIFFLN